MFRNHIHALIEDFRTNGIAELAQPADRLAPGQRGRAAAFGMNVVVALWLAGLGSELGKWIDTAIEWLETDDGALVDSDRDGAVGLRRRYRALAIAKWLQGSDDPTVWRKAAKASVAADVEDDPVSLADQVPFGEPSIECGTVREPKAWLTRLPDSADRPPQIAVGDVGRYIAESALEWLARGAYVQTAAWLHYATSPISNSPATARQIFRFLVPAARPVTERSELPGGRDESVVMGGLGDYRDFEPLLCLLGLTRDPDAVAQGDPPAFVSWTRRPDLSLEVDWHAPPGETPRLEIRGSGAGRLAALIVDTAGGRIGSDPQDALTALLSVPRRAQPASPAAAEVRWEVLCSLLGEPHALEEMGGRAVVEAGLADSDWRVRMAALWAVGHHRLPGLAAKAEATALPKSGYEGLSQEDRRVLLAMRDLASARSAGRADSPKKGANAGFVASIAALLDKVPDRAETRAELLITTLLRGGEADYAALPSAWKRWATRAGPATRLS